MNRHLFSVLALGALLAGPAAGVAQEPEEDTRPGVAVFPLDNGGSHGPGAEAENFEALEVGLQQMMLTEFAVNSELRIVERGRLREIMEEQDLLAEGRVDAATAARVGQIVGARYVVLGSFLDLMGDFHMNARIVDTETTETLEARKVQGRREEIYPLLLDLTAQLTEAANLPPLPGEQREARQQREIPLEAVNLYSQAQVFEDAGLTEEAITLYRRITQEFPQMEEAQQALVQLTG